MANERRKTTESNPASISEDRPQPADEKVRSRAYEIYEARGREPGHDWDDWLEAERELQPKRERE
jgi:hypothetical protein